MKFVIYKYTLHHGLNTVDTFFGKHLSVGLDPVGQLCAWRIVFLDGDEPTQKTSVIYNVIFTGEHFDDLKVFLGTVSDENTGLVYHVFGA